MNRCILYVVLCMLWAATTRGERPLHERIDAAVESRQAIRVMDTASDAEFIRRIYLDLLGTVPSSTETRLFLSDASADKRQQWVDRIIEDPRLDQRLANVFDVMLMERTPDGQVKSAEWYQYLYDSFAANKPYNELAREILSASGAQDSSRPAARFYLDRAGETNRLTRDVGRMFLGMDMQCAQCHDHPLVDSYYQRDYYGLFAFLNRSYIFTNTAKKNFFAEKSVGNVSFKSVFTEEAGETGPHLPGDAPVAEPVLKKLDEYKIRPRTDTVSVPAFSRREQLAMALTGGKNEAFNRNIANRLWGLMNGRALVMPVDLQHVDNPPLNSELMDVLQQGMVELGFDVKAYLRQIALSKTYQRGYQLDIPAKLSLSEIQSRIDLIVTECEQREGEVDVAREAWEQLRQKVLDHNTKWAEPRAAYIKADTAATAQLDKYLKQDGDRITASESIAVRTPKRDALAVAHAEISNALKTLPEEKSLQDAAATFKKKLDALNAELTKLEDTRTKAEANATAELEKLTPLQTALDEAWKVWEPGKKESQLIAIDEQNARNIYETRYSLVSALESQQSRLRRMQSTAELRQQQVVQQQQLQQTVKTIETSMNKIAGDKKEFLVLQGQQQADQKAYAQATLNVTELKKQHDEKEKAVELMADLIATTNSAVQSVAQQADVVATLKQLNQQQIRLGAEMAESIKNVAQAESQAAQQAKQLQSSTTQVAAMNTLLEKDLVTVENVRQQHAREQQQLTKLSEQLQDSTEKLSTTLVREFMVSDLRPLTPEQLANTVMESLGVTESIRIQVAAEIDKANPLTDADREDKAKLDRRQRAISEAVRVKILAWEVEFVKLYGAAAGQVQTDFFSTIDQALYVTNGGRIRGWVDSNSYLAGQLDKMEEPEALAEQLYISLLCRLPTEQELVEIKNYLAARGEQKAEAVREMVWALLASAEFRFNH